MRIALLFFISALLSACAGYRPDQRVVGRFESPAGEAVAIRPDGRILYVNAGKEEFVGLVTIDKEEPLSIRVIAPDTSPLVGAKFVFSTDRRQITAEWPTWQRASDATNRSISFRSK